MRKGDPDEGEDEPAPVQTRLPDRQQCRHQSGYQSHRQHGRPGDDEPARDNVDRRIGRRVGGADGIRPGRDPGARLHLGHSRIVCPRSANKPRLSDLRHHRSRWAAKKSDQESTSGCRLSNARRWRSVMPPQTPNSISLSSASARHSATTGHGRQITAAFRCAAPRTKSSSGSVERHRARATHAVRLSSAELVNSVMPISSERTGPRRCVVDYSTLLVVDARQFRGIVPAANDQDVDHDNLLVVPANPSACS